MCLCLCLSLPVCLSVLVLQEEAGAGAGSLGSRHTAQEALQQVRALSTRQTRELQEKIQRSNARDFAAPLPPPQQQQQQPSSQGAGPARPVLSGPLRDMTSSSEGGESGHEVPVPVSSALLMQRIRVLEAESLVRTQPCFFPCVCASLRASVLPCRPCVSVSYVPLRYYNSVLLTGVVECLLVVMCFPIYVVS